MQVYLQYLLPCFTCVKFAHSSLVNHLAVEYLDVHFAIIFSFLVLHTPRALKYLSKCIIIKLKSFFCFPNRWKLEIISIAMLFFIIHRNDYKLRYIYYKMLQHI